MPEKVCPLCGQVIPHPEGRLICSICSAPIKRGQGGWTHGGDGRPHHNNCNGTKPAETAGTMELIS